MNGEGLHAAAENMTATGDCWNDIGVRGDRSCAQLVAQVHCHNCPVYSAAAKALLDTAAPNDYCARWTEHFAQPPPAADADTYSVMIFRVGAEWLAIPTRLCVEITHSQAIHTLPHQRNAAILGVTNVRGVLLVCISLAALLHLTPAAPTTANRRTVLADRLLVLGWSDGAVAVPVDEVLGVRRCRARDLQEIPATVARGQATYTKGILQSDEHSIGLLDEQLLCYTISRSLA